MIFLDNYDGFKYTKVQVPIALAENPYDYENHRYFLDVECDSFYQQDCYIGSQHIEEMSVRREKRAKEKDEISYSKWEVEMIIDEVKKEEEIIEILDNLCYMLSLAYVKNHRYFQHSGFNGFSFKNIHIKRRYAAKDQVFGDVVFNSTGMGIETKTVNYIRKNIFELPKDPVVQSTYIQSLQNAFLTALKSRDTVSRYILLYYLFEIMYGTQEYKSLKLKFENKVKSSNIKTKKDSNEKRSEILCQYLQQEFSLIEYYGFDEQRMLTDEILYEIIITRNNLAHRADISKISEIMYQHLIPILQCVLNMKNDEQGDKVND